jgi:VanZ family protein
MGLIFFLSAQSDLDSGLGLVDLVGRKLLHAAEYGLLTVLWTWALAPVITRRGGTGLPDAALPAAAIAFAYAISDEYHQSLVAGRTASPMDVAIDAIGIALALAYLLWRFRRGSSTAAR